MTLDSAAASVAAPPRSATEPASLGRGVRVFGHLIQPAALTTGFTIWYLGVLNGHDLFLPVVIGVTVLLSGLEILVPHRRDWNSVSLREVAIDWIIWFLAILFFVGPFIGALYNSPTVVDLFAQVRARLGLEHLWPSAWPLLPRAALAILLSELCAYWIHRGQHRWLTLWRWSGHVTHHALTRMNGVKTWHSHPVDLLFIFFSQAFIAALLGAGVMEMTAAGLFNYMQGQFVHANLPIQVNWFSWLFTIPRWHYRHHSLVGAETTSNFGCMLALWDRLFGTFVDSTTADTGIEGFEHVASPVRELALPVTRTRF
jgi:sterol desaturase/sphingolipid hydroxylase (fatty acid hydroxylase superfamily)